MIPNPSEVAASSRSRWQKVQHALKTQRHDACPVVYPATVNNIAAELADRCAAATLTRYARSIASTGKWQRSSCLTSPRELLTIVRTAAGGYVDRGVLWAHIGFSSGAPAVPR
jgi:hypothetical protein